MEDTLISITKEVKQSARISRLYMNTYSDNPCRVNLHPLSRGRDTYAPVDYFQLYSYHILKKVTSAIPLEKDIFKRNQPQKNVLEMWYICI